MPKITVHGGSEPPRIHETPEVPEVPAQPQYADWSLAKLRAELKERELPTHGRREDLIERLKDN